MIFCSANNLGLHRNANWSGIPFSIVIRREIPVINCRDMEGKDRLYCKFTYVLLLSLCFHSIVYTRSVMFYYSNLAENLIVQKLLKRATSKYPVSTCVLILECVLFQLKTFISLKDEGLSFLDYIYQTALVLEIFY